MTNKPSPQWRSVVSDAVQYDPLTGTYKYTQKAVPKNYNQFWTPMGQPRQQQQQKIDIGIMQTSIENKDKSPRKEKKKKPKPK